jgi:uncharacterized protein
MSGTFEIFQADGHYSFRLTDEDHRVLAVSGSYESKMDAARAITAVRENAAAGHVIDATGEPRNLHAAGRGHRAPTRSHS